MASTPIHEEALVGDIYMAMIEGGSLTTLDICKKLNRKTQCVQRCLAILKKQSLVFSSGNNDLWHVTDSADNSSGYQSDFHEDDSLDTLNLKSIASSLSEIEDVSQTSAKQKSSVCSRGQQQKETAASSLSDLTEDQSEPNIWSCSTCTYLNEQKDNKCKICRTQNVTGASIQKLREETSLKCRPAQSLNMEETNPKLEYSQNSSTGSSMQELRKQTSLKHISAHSLDVEETSPKFGSSANPVRDMCRQREFCVSEQTIPKCVPQPSEQTIPKCVPQPMLQKEIGGIKISTSSPITEIRTETIDPGIKPFLDNLKQVLQLFNDPSSKNLKPADVAKKCQIGVSKKDVNSYLYFLEKKGILNKVSEDGNRDPRWSGVPNNLSTVTPKQLLEWAAELAKKPKGKNQGKISKPAETADLEEHHHHHHHHHHHKNYIQVGDDSQMHIGEIQDALTDRERLAEGGSQTQRNLLR